MAFSLVQVGEKYRIKNDIGGFHRKVGTRKLSKDKAEFRLAMLNGEEPYDYTNNETSSEVSETIDAAIDAYIATQDRNIATAQGKIEAAQATIEAEQANISAQEEIIANAQAVLDNPDATEEEKAQATSDIATAQAAITASEKKITTNQNTIVTQTKNIATYESNKENAATKVTSITIEDIPEVLTLCETGYKVTVKGDFSKNENTTIEANEKLQKPLQITNTGEPANVTIDLGNSEGTIAGPWDEVVVKSVSDNTLTVAVGAHINKLVVKKGRVKVANALVSDNIDEVVVEGGEVVANEEVIASSASSFYSKPAIIKINKNLSFTYVVTGILTMGHFIYENNAKVEFTKTGSTSAGYMIRGGNLLAEFKGSGEWHSANNPVIWLSDFDGVVKIYDGKFFNDANHSECIYAEKGFIEIYGGEFHNVDDGSKNFLLNCLDANYKAGKSNITVYGGTFYGFNPAANAAESSDNTTNFVAEGYHVIESVDAVTGENIYTVVKDEDESPVDGE